MLLRLLPVALLVCTLFAVAPEATATCAGVENGGSCVGAYLGCSLNQCLFVADPYVCVGLYDAGSCTGLQKP